MTPTGLGIRNDEGGLGHFGAPRKKEVKGHEVRYTHDGVDYQCKPGQEVWMPCTGKIVRVAYPYAAKDYSGVYIAAKRLSMKMFYVQPYSGIIGRVIKKGEPIGTAQDISLKYPGAGVTPHVHVKLVRCDPEILMRRQFDEID